MYVCVCEEGVPVHSAHSPLGGGGTSVAHSLPWHPARPPCLPSSLPPFSLPLFSPAPLSLLAPYATPLWLVSHSVCLPTGCAWVSKSLIKSYSHV